MGKVSDLVTKHQIVSLNSVNKVSWLTPREREVVHRISTGLQNKDIARGLGISTKTVEKHRAAAKSKIGVESSAMLVRVYVVHQLIGFEKADDASQ